MLLCLCMLLWMNTFLQVSVFKQIELEMTIWNDYFILYNYTVSIAIVMIFMESQSTEYNMYPSMISHVYRQRNRCHPINYERHLNQHIWSLLQIWYNHNTLVLVNTGYWILNEWDSILIRTGVSDTCMMYLQGYIHTGYIILSQHAGLMNS